jgi:hypothetical protein
LLLLFWGEGLTFIPSPERTTVLQDDRNTPPSLACIC